MVVLTEGSLERLSLGENMCAHYPGFEQLPLLKSLPVFECDIFCIFRDYKTFVMRTGACSHVISQTFPVLRIKGKTVSLSLRNQHRTKQKQNQYARKLFHF